MNRFPNEAKKYISNTYWLLVGQIFQMGIAFLVGAYLARYLGPSNYGLLVFARSYVQLFGVIATLGLDTIVIRNLVQRASNQNEILGTAFALKVAGGILLLGVLTITVSFTSNDIQVNLLIIIIGFGTMFQSFNVINFYFQSKVLSKFVVYTQFTVTSISSILKVLLIYINSPLINFAYIIAFESIIFALGLILSLKKQNMSFSEWKLSKKIAIELIKDSWPFIFTDFFILIYLRFNQILIRTMLNSTQLGLFAVAVTLGEIWYFIPIAITGSMFPAIIHAKQKDEKLYYNRLQKLYDLVVWIAIAIALCMTILSEFIINILYGNQYYESGIVLKIYLWAGIFVFFGVARGKWILTENLQKFSIFYTGVGAISNIGLNLILIPHFGICGSALAAVITNFFVAVGAPFLIKETRPSCRHFIETFNLRRIVGYLFDYLFKSRNSEIFTEHP